MLTMTEDSTRHQVPTLEFNEQVYLWDEATKSWVPCNPVSGAQDSGMYLDG